MKQFFLSRYNLVFLGLTYVVPVIAMAVCYTLMGRELWGSRSIGELTQRQLDSIKSKRKVSTLRLQRIDNYSGYHGVITEKTKSHRLPLIHLRRQDLGF
jgi:hypothetical protein